MCTCSDTKTILIDDAKFCTCLVMPLVAATLAVMKVINIKEPCPKKIRGVCHSVLSEIEQR